MCLRGRARSFDEDGLCGRQKLVCSGDRQRLLRNVRTLYPGAQITLANADTGRKHSSRADALLELLSDPSLPNVVTTNWIGQQLKRPWREIATKLMKIAGMREALEALGWRYVAQRGRPGRGQGGSRFERIVESPEVDVSDTSPGNVPLDVVLAVRALTKAVALPDGLQYLLERLL